MVLRLYGVDNDVEPWLQDLDVEVLLHDLVDGGGLPCGVLLLVLFVLVFFRDIREFVETPDHLLEEVSLLEVEDISDQDL